MRGEHISFYVVFVAAVDREIITIGVDYTERRKTEREKRKNVCFPHYITGGPPQREEVLCEK